MTLSKLTKIEQILLATVILVLLLGSYSFFRFIPENSAIGKLQRQATKTEQQLHSAQIPDEPEQSVEELLKELDEKEQVLAMTQTMADSVSQRLASFGSQQLKVSISELARNTGVRIRTNEAFQTITKVKVNKAKSKAKAKAIAAKTDLILPANYSWIERMSQKTVFHRPIQRLVLEGDYQSLRAFVHGLENLEWQVTVVRFNLEIMPAAPLRGYAQQLKSELVLAL